MTEAELNKQKYLEVLDKYTLNQNLRQADIFHMYPKEDAFPNGYYDSKFFTLVIYNTTTMEKAVFEDRDGISYYSNSIDVFMHRIYLDGSFFTRFRTLHQFDIFQNIFIR